MVTHLISTFGRAGEFEAIIVCLGAGAVLLPELAGKLPLKMIRGKVLDMQAPDWR